MLLALYVFWPRMVSIVSQLRGRMAEEGAARRAYRQRVYNMSSAAQDEPVPPSVPVSAPVHGTTATAIDLTALGSNLTEAQYIELGARLMDRRGKYVFSGKTLYKIAGGNHDEFLANMRRWRGEETHEEEPVHVTPIVGRPTRAQFETDMDYPYQAPAH
jgi:hypothetical protein